jgi:glycosyltransferase involved in cell wall biosynthesis
MFLDSLTQRKCIMEILYVSNTTSTKYFKCLYDESFQKPGQQVQKFNEMLLRGFKEHANVRALTVPPATNKTIKKNYFKNITEYENDILYDYVGFLNFPIIKQMFVKWNAKRKIKAWIKQTEGSERVIMCYALSPTLSSIALSMAKKHGVKCMAVVTDIPELMNVSRETTSLKSFLYNIYSKSTSEMLTQYDSYVLLTEAMTDVVNPENKPYIVVEGMVDSDMEGSENSLQEKYSSRVVIYAGALFEKYGVLNLVEGFIRADVPDCELWLYGNGEMEDYLNNLKNDNVKYFGVVPNNEVVEHEIKATLLVNPRPSTEEFTKYSFPSKNMEYMMSGTPVLTCKLPGMPHEYLDYVYIAEDESADGFSEALKDILSKDSSELHDVGIKAKEFVTNNKSNIMQAKRILDFAKIN